MVQGLNNGLTGTLPASWGRSSPICSIISAPPGLCGGCRWSWQSRESARVSPAHISGFKRPWKVKARTYALCGGRLQSLCPPLYSLSHTHSQTRAPKAMNMYVIKSQSFLFWGPVTHMEMPLWPSMRQQKCGQRPGSARTLASFKGARRGPMHRLALGRALQSSTRVVHSPMCGS
jgi:hypothetical protein